MRINFALLHRGKGLKYVPHKEGLMGPEEVVKKPESNQAAEFETLVSCHLDALFGYALSLTRNKAKAEDLLQDACLKAFKAFHQFEPNTNMKAWLSTILRNTFFNDYRKKKNAPDQVSLEECTDFSFYAEAYFANQRAPATTVPYTSLNDWNLEKVFGDEVTKALHSLPDEYREAIFLCEVQEFSYEEIAKILQVPLGTVRSRLARARGQLQKLLWDYAQKKGILKK